MTKKIDHIVYAVTDLEAAMDEFEKLSGCALSLVATIRRRERKMLSSISAMNVIWKF